MKFIKMLYNDEDTYELLEKLNSYKPPHDKLVTGMVIFGIIYVLSIGFMMYEIEVLKVKLHKSQQIIKQMVEFNAKKCTQCGDCLKIDCPGDCIF